MPSVLHMIGHHGMEHPQIADVLDGSQLWRIDRNLFNNKLQMPHKALYSNFDLWYSSDWLKKEFTWYVMLKWPQTSNIWHDKATE